MALADNFQGLCSPLHPSSEGNVVWPLGIACFATAYTPSVGEACKHACLFSRLSVNYFLSRRKYLSVNKHLWRIFSHEILFRVEKHTWDDQLESCPCLTTLGRWTGKAACPHCPQGSVGTTCLINI